MKNRLFGLGIPNSVRKAFDINYCNRLRKHSRVEESHLIIQLTILRSAKGAAFIASPPQDGFAVANLVQRPRILWNRNASAASATHFGLNRACSVSLSFDSNS